MAITNPTHESIGITAESVTVIGNGNRLRVKSLDGGGIVAFRVITVGGTTVAAAVDAVGNDNAEYLAAVAGDTVCLPITAIGPPDVGVEVVLSMIASVATVVVVGLESD
jgi:translation elongation factor EF-1alpha